MTTDLDTWHAFSTHHFLGSSSKVTVTEGMLLMWSMWQRGLSSAQCIKYHIQQFYMNVNFTKCVRLPGICGATWSTRCERISPGMPSRMSTSTRVSVDEIWYTRIGLGSANTNSAWFARICGQLFISRPTKCDLTSGLDLTSPFLNFEKQPSATIVRAPYSSFNMYTISLVDKQCWWHTGTWGFWSYDYHD